ncbi:MAG: hypothetical protein KY468_19620, partial [Armatimonadetes bacterium]|nr:hypothetical protein [Armatimonadota bacterium]
MQQKLPVRKRKITPTDLSQYLRLDQCERYLRLRLHERSEGRDFLSDANVHPQEIPPLLTLSGRAFEKKTEEAMRAAFPFVHCAENAREHGGTRSPDNDRVLELAGRL